jgi:hypothetical protein
MSENYTIGIEREGKAAPALPIIRAPERFSLITDSYSNDRHVMLRAGGPLRASAAPDPCGPVPRLGTPPHLKVSGKSSCVEIFNSSGRALHVGASHGDILPGISD